MGLNKEQRDALPDSSFAVPGKRKLPIHDATHVRLAWDMVDRTSGLTEEERRDARAHILREAKELGVDTTGWHITASIEFQAMAIVMPEVDGHPNRMPFTGVLTRVDQPSDMAPHGSNGKRTVIPRAVAEAAIPSLLGMAVDYTPQFDGHDKKSKIGIITAAEVVDDAIEIEGFFYAADFPEECARIQAEKDSLGFSYECQARIQDLEADQWVLDYCVFTGAAVLYKNLAAYTTTSLSASAEKDDDMSEELKKLLESISASVLALTKEVTDLKASAAKPAQTIDAGATSEKVKPHAEALRACANSMEAAGIGTHSTDGHANVLRHMAASMEAEAAMGNLPHIYQNAYVSKRMEAAGDKQPTQQPAIDSAVAKQIETLSASIADIGTKLQDLSAKAFTNAEPPDRKTVSPEIKSLLAKAGLTEPAEGSKLDVDNVNKTLAAAGIKGTAAIEAKLKLMNAGMLPAS